MNKLLLSLFTPITTLFLVTHIILTGCKTETTSETAEEMSDSTTVKPVPYQAISLLGDTLYAMELSPERQAQYDSVLQASREYYQQQPDSVDRLVWVGRRLGYLSRYQESIDTFTEGIQQFPDSPELYRHRGHRYITTRQFDKAIADLEKSAKLLEGQPIIIEPDGIPIPVPAEQEPTSLQFNVYYHLGLAHYLKGDYGKAAEAYQQCLEYCDDSDEVVATVDWLYMTYRRLGEDEVAERLLAEVEQEMDIVANEGYFERLLMYKGMMAPDSLLQIPKTASPDDRALQLATKGYGVANYYLNQGDSSAGTEMMKDIVDGRYWAAFGYIAAEADLARLEEAE
ncbi:tetratricopeptide repeat protein [Tunicatimonas pelagia]|uniref:tetratricopeptide repeat protein n=1 Tax=Tunicatimonas pelagia TaxID=931531 RepID=UPI002665A2E0|nr:tetratricopeptide repeat protein [Tunicatimonas pelagia]WKN43938.1 tetratricopeptide repeat protein [Tunicatimonas pelagia]